MTSLPRRKMRDYDAVAARGTIDGEVTIGWIASDVLVAMGTGEFDVVQHRLKITQRAAVLGEPMPGRRAQ